MFGSMRWASLVLSFLLVAGAQRGPVLHAQACADPARPLALVLSGGGAKGMAHVGVLQVLDSLGIRPDLVVGTSMGAIVGALYASGLTADEILAGTSALDLDRRFNATDPKTPRAISEHRPILVWEAGASGPRSSEAYAREAATNSALSAALLRGNLIARGDFDSLPIPFRAVATDLRTREEVVLSTGDLALAVRASMGVPIVFDPVRIGGRDLIDGGIAANVPVAAARRAGAARVLVSDVGGQLPDSIVATDPLAVANLMVDYLFKQPAESLGADDRLIRAPVDTFANLEFDAARISELVRLGREAARVSFAERPSCDSPMLQPRRKRGQGFRLAPEAGQALEGETRTLWRYLGLEPATSLDVDRLQATLGDLAQSDEYLAVWLNPSGRQDSLSFELATRRAPRRLLVASAAYDNDLGGQLWAGVADRGQLIRGLELSGLGVLGELRRELTAGVRLGAYGHRRLRAFITGRLIWEDVRQFTASGGDLPAIASQERSIAGGLELRIGSEWLLVLGGGFQGWDSDSGSADQAGGLGARLASGPHYRTSRLSADGDLNAVFRRVEGDARYRFAIGSFGLTPHASLGWGDSLPVARTFELGGAAGFPGYHIGQLRGDRMAFAQLAIDRPLVGPVGGRVRAAAGQVATGGSVIPQEDWEFGFGVGLTAESPIGPLVLEYGVSVDGTDRWLLRVGEWF
ncbi:MAG: patatin-like phospholipase family protein [Gemmatimonadota bacterium]|nr:patatin-like phospholipase family protein [Gemmatimonadota bacterium]